ncbi:MAG: PASTA domain-containing protein [Balneolaceae bacterium]|nr:PASTA domain-containing protein [Balneolaceae bacterium]
MKERLTALLKSRKLWITAASALGGLAVLLVVLDFWIMPALTNYDEGVTVPDVSHLALEEAQALLTSYGLRNEVSDRRSNTAFPANYVIDQTPAAAEIVKPRRKIYLTVNTVTTPTVVVPEVVNLSLRNARIQLQNYGLQVGAVSFESSRFKSSVLRQSVAPGDTVPKGMVVDLTVSDGLGQKMVTVPDIVGLKITEAQQKLREVGLRAELRFQPSDAQPPNTILDYTPRQEQIVEGETLVLIVSEQPDMIEEQEGGVIDTTYVPPPDSTGTDRIRTGDVRTGDSRRL